MKIKYTLGAAALLALGCALPAFAEDSDKPDRDRGPGRPGMAQRFEQADADKSGGVSLEEMQAQMLEHTQKRFAEMDANKDGALTKDEFKAHPRRDGKGPRGKGKRRHHGEDDDANEEGGTE